MVFTAVYRDVTNCIGETESKYLGVIRRRLANLHLQEYVIATYKGFNPYKKESYMVIERSAPTAKHYSEFWG